jgi:flagellar biogenesis protein FliO
MIGLADFNWWILAQAGAPETAVGSQVWDGGGYGALMALLLLMIAVLGALFFFVKRGGLPRMKKSGHLELLETRPLGGRQFIVVGQYGEERFLLGVCPGKIDFLCRLDHPPAEVDSLMDELATKEGDES